MAPLRKVTFFSGDTSWLGCGKAFFENNFASSLAGTSSPSTSPKRWGGGGTGPVQMAGAGNEEPGRGVGYRDQSKDPGSVFEQNQDRASKYIVTKDSLEFPGCLWEAKSS